MVQLPALQDQHFPPEFKTRLNSLTQSRMKPTKVLQGSEVREACNNELSIATRVYTVCEGVGLEPREPHRETL